MATKFEHQRHPWVLIRPKSPPKTTDEHIGFNGRLGATITRMVGSMWAAYLFALLAFVSLPSAIRSGDPVTLVSWISQTFLQLVLLAVIMVGQQVLGAAADKRADQTYHDAEAILHECLELQRHLAQQDETLEKQDQVLARLLREREVKSDH